MPTRFFSPAEANAALQVIRPAVEEIQSIRRSILGRRPDLWPALERAAGNGGSQELSRLATEFERLDELVHSILDTGAIIKDLSAGLIDFPSLRKEQTVYLCWRFGEDGIRFWHEVDAGYAGRKDLDSF